MLRRPNRQKRPREKPEELQDAWILRREPRGPRPETDSVRTMPPWRQARPGVARLAERLSKGRVNLDRPAGK